MSHVQQRYLNFQNDFTESRVVAMIFRVLTNRFNFTPAFKLHQVPVSVPHPEIFVDSNWLGC